MNFQGAARDARFDTTAPRRNWTTVRESGSQAAPEVLMTESFAQLFEESLASQKIKPGDDSIAAATSRAVVAAIPLCSITVSAASTITRRRSSLLIRGDTGGVERIA